MATVGPLAGTVRVAVATVDAPAAAVGDPSLLLGVYCQATARGPSRWWSRRARIADSRAGLGRGGLWRGSDSDIPGRPGEALGRASRPRRPEGGLLVGPEPGSSVLSVLRLDGSTPTLKFDGWRHTERGSMGRLLPPTTERSDEVEQPRADAPRPAAGLAARKIQVSGPHLSTPSLRKCLPPKETGIVPARGK